MLNKTVVILVEAGLGSVVFTGVDVTLKVISVIIMAVVGWFTVKAHRSTIARNKREEEKNKTN
jgi:hypothetical protein